MSIEQTDLVDIISIDRMTGEVILTISDHLDWSDCGAHLLLLQSKLNRYLAFVESGEILQSYPKAKAIIYLPYQVVIDFRDARTKVCNP